MNTNRDCGCKSFRTCKICERKFGIERDTTAERRLEAVDHVLVYDPITESLTTADGDGDPCECLRDFPGVKLIPDFASEAEEAQLVRDLDEIPWDLSVSGRRKQNYGPRANFKGRKVKAGPFAGFPAVTRFVQERFAAVGCLRDYRTVEQCSIEYEPRTGAAIEPHIDDCWVWGERIVQLNLLSDTVLTFLPYRGGSGRYNLADLELFPRVLSPGGDRVLFNPFDPACDASDAAPYERVSWPDGVPAVAVRLRLPRRSLLVLHGEARYDWEHCVLRDDIASRRIVIAYREFTPPFLPGGRHFQTVGKEVLERAAKFW